MKQETVRFAALKHWVSTDDSYREMTARYDRTDGVLTLALYASLLIVYYLMGVLTVRSGLYFGVPVNLLLIPLCVALARGRRQSPASVGITAKNLKKALLSGLACGVFFSFTLNVLPSMLAGGQVIPPGRAVYYVFYYFIVIALPEEIVFRGYIQTRIYGLIKNDIPAVLVTGLLFYVMHLPFQVPVNGMQVSLPNMAVMVALHVLHNLLYRKYNSLAAPVVLHGLLDWGGNLFR